MKSLKILAILILGLIVASGSSQPREDSRNDKESNLVLQDDSPQELVNSPIEISYQLRFQESDSNIHLVVYDELGNIYLVQEDPGNLIPIESAYNRENLQDAGDKFRVLEKSKYFIQPEYNHSEHYSGSMSGDHWKT